MIDDKDLESVEMNAEKIDMPPLDYNLPTDQPDQQAVESYGLPPEILAAQEFERNQSKVLAQEQEDTHRSVEPERPEPLPQSSYVSQSNEAETNLRILREAMRERDMLAKRLQEYESSQQQKVESPDEDFNIKEEELVEGKHLARAFKRIRQLEEQQKQYVQQTSLTTAEMRLRQQFPDFDKVMTVQNLQALSEKLPEMARAINASPDLYDKASSAYNIIKRFGIYAEPTPVVVNNTAKTKVLSNTAKPRPATSVNAQKGDSPISRVNMFQNGFNEDVAEILRKEMDEYSKLY